MAKPIFKVRDEGGLKIIVFEIPQGVTTPEEFSTAIDENAALLTGGPKGVVIDGRGPVWAYGMLLHEAHPSTFVATRDPRLGAVVVETHTPDVKRGQILSFPVDPSERTH